MKLAVLTALLLLVASGCSSVNPAQPDAFRPGSVFRDCAECPRMVVIPGGSFLIGSPEDEAGRYRNEGPRRSIAITALAVSETELTKAQYTAFVAATARADARGCFTHGDVADLTSDEDLSASWRNPAFEQAPNHPVTCVSWEDAHAYAAWLTQRTGHAYRLLSEAEWEYAARAGAGTPFFWGAHADSGCAHMNGADQTLIRALPAWERAVQNEARAGDQRAGVLACDDGIAFTAAAGSYRANAFGLHDMSGNVWEFVADCWNPAGYEALLSDGAPQIASPCPLRRARGGSWDDYPVDLRSARRTSGVAPTLRRNDMGFRVARVLPNADTGNAY